MSSTNPFDALNSIEEGASGNPSNTTLVARINDIESQMIDGKLVLLDDDGKPLKPSKSTLPSSSNVVSKKLMIWLVRIMIAKFKRYMMKLSLIWRHRALMLIKLLNAAVEGNKSLYEQCQESHGEDSYDGDDFDDPGLTDAQMKFANAFDINLRGNLDRICSKSYKFGMRFL
nr:hypothetical protein [Tanacetum cinerariifolium]